MLSLLYLKVSASSGSQFGLETYMAYTAFLSSKSPAGWEGGIDSRYLIMCSFLKL